MTAKKKGNELASSTAFKGPVICPTCRGQKWNPTFLIGRHQYISCNECRIVTTNPLPTENDLEDFYSSKNEKDDIYSLNMTKWMDLRVDVYSNYLKILYENGKIDLNGKKVLDVGCFNGASLKAIAKAGGDAYGMERQAESTRQLETIFPGKIYHRNACLPDTTLNETFDIITMTDVVEHVLDPEALLRNAWSWLKPGGYLFLTTPNTKSLVSRLMGKHWPSYLPVHHVYLFNKENLGKLLLTNGFTPISAGILTKKLTLEYFVYVMSRFRSQFAFLERLIPRFLSKMSLRFFGGEMYLIARKP